MLNQTIVNEDTYVELNNDNFDYTRKYSDEYYANYIKTFVPSRKKKIFYRIIKRICDIIISLIALIILFPVFLVVAIAIKIDSKGPVIFKQKRAGKNCKSFWCFKFRSMVITAPANNATSTFKDVNNYITKVGRFLRKTSIDELPQLINCLIGNMSIVGPRPVVFTEENVIDMRNQLHVYSVKPGLTGFSQINGRDDVYYKNKAIMDAEYVKKSSLWVDFKIMIKTVIYVLKRKGNDANKKVEDEQK